MNSSPGTNTHSDEQYQSLIHVEQVKLLYKALPLSLTTALINAVILTIIQLQVIGLSNIIGWLAVILFVTILRTWFLLAFKQAEINSDTIKIHYRRVVAGALLSGISWGMAGWLMFPAADVVHQTFLAFVLAGMSAGAVTTLSPKWHVALLFLLPALLPLILRFLLFEEGAISLAMGIMISLFFIIIVSTSRRLYKTTEESLNLRFAHQEAQTALAEAAEQNQLILESTAEGIFGVDPNGICTFVNPAAAYMLGYDESELLGLDIHPSIHHSYMNGRPYPSHLCPMNLAITTGKPQHVDDEILWRKDCSSFPVDYFSTPILKEGVIQGAVVSFRDISERKETEALLEHQAFFDALTNLPNRHLLLNRMQQILARCIRKGHIGAVLFIDLDRFKAINDALGHTIGNALLVNVAARLTQDLRQEDTAARLSGDEFVILLSEFGDDLETVQNQVRTYGERISEILSQPYEIEGHQLHITPSIGISLFPMGNEKEEDILREADIAMYRAKEQGRNMIQFYLPSMQDSADERLALENDLRQALIKNQLILYFQAQVTSSGQISGAEILLRWQHPERGIVPPLNFIPLAEDTGLILPIGEWVLLETCRLLKQSKEEPSQQQLALSVNVSPRQFRQKSFVDQVIAILDETGADPASLELELTEGIVIADVEDTIEKMNALRKLGVRFAIDDFGTGYSSLNYLKRLPLDRLKIDQSFVRDITTDPSNAAIVETIIAMAHHLQLDVVAEGVEEEEELSFLKDKGCQTYQGYYFSRPISWEDYKLFLLERSAESR